MIPNYLEDVKAAKAKYPEAWSHAHVAGDPKAWDFIRLLAKDLYAKDKNVGLNGKRGNPGDLSMDALNILCEAADSAGRTPDGLPCAVIDVIVSAGIPSASPGWTPYTTVVEGSGAWVKPGEVVTPPQPPTTPVYPPYPGDQPFDELGNALFKDYATAEHAPDPGMGRWFGRTEYDWLTGICKTLAESIKKHEVEWRQGLNDWRASAGKPPITNW